MLKYLMKLRSRKGFTLVELVIVMGILAVLMACVAAFATPVRQMVRSTAASTDSINANKIMGDYIENRLAFAQSVSVVAAVDADTGTDTNLTDNYAIFKQKMIDTTNNKDKAGMLIFHYTSEDPTGATEESLESRYEIYDVPITKTSTYSSSVDFTNKKFAVFGDGFYNFSQNIIAAPLSAESNKVRDSQFVTFEIVPFDCDVDYNAYIEPDFIGNYYAANTTTGISADEYFSYTNSSAINELDTQRSGVMETITFELQNIHSGSDNWKGCLGTTTGSDIVIFYYIKNF